MKTQNRPELKVGDRVRFRSDGEIGELNRSQNLNTEIFHTVKKICKDGRVYHEGGGSYAQVQFDICNDFSDIQVGDKVERYHWKHGITTDTVASVSENDFKLEICETIGCKLSISKADGLHGNFPKGGDYWYVLRIVEKAKPKPIADCNNCKHVCTKSNIDYCHMYEPKPTYKVGDWVEYGGKQYQITSVNHNCTFSGETLVMFGGVIWGVTDMTKLRKLPPSEVKVMITLEGTVSKICGNTLAFELEDNNGVVTAIGYQQLDPATRDLVESLLKAQEEK